MYVSKTERDTHRWARLHSVLLLSQRNGNFRTARAKRHFAVFMPFWQRGWAALGSPHCFWPFSECTTPFSLRSPDPQAGATHLNYGGLKWGMSVWAELGVGRGVRSLSLVLSSPGTYMVSQQWPWICTLPTGRKAPQARDSLCVLHGCIPAPGMVPGVLHTRWALYSIDSVSEWVSNFILSPMGKFPLPFLFFFLI